MSKVHRHGSVHAQALAVSHAAGSQCAGPAVHAPSGRREVCGFTQGCSAGCAQKIYKEGGMSALFKGNFATMVKVAPQTAIQFAVSLLQIRKPALSSGIRNDSLVHACACSSPLQLLDVFSYCAVQVPS